jgi:hypothetical protein
VLFVYVLLNDFVCSPIYIGSNDSIINDKLIGNYVQGSDRVLILGNMKAFSRRAQEIHEIPQIWESMSQPSLEPVAPKYKFEALSLEPSFYWGYNFINKIKSYRKLRM